MTRDGDDGEDWHPRTARAPVAARGRAAARSLESDRRATETARPPRASGRFAADAGRSARGSLAPRSRRASFRVDGCDTLPSRSPHPSPSRQQSRSACSSASTTTRALSAPWRPSRRTIRQVTVPAPRSISVGCSAHRRLPAIWPEKLERPAPSCATSGFRSSARWRRSRQVVDLRELWAFAYETELQLADACGRTVMEYQRDRG